MAPAGEQYADFEEWVWRRLPRSRHLIGRRGVAALLPHAVAFWSPEMPRDPDDPALELVVGVLRSEARRRYGSIWIILLSGLLAEMVRLLVEWWLTRDSHGELLAAWKGSLDGRTHR